MKLNSKEVVKILNSIEDCYTCVGFDDYIITYGDGRSTSNLNEYINGEFAALIIYEYDAIKDESIIHEENYNYMMQQMINRAIENQKVAHRYAKCNCGAECENRVVFYSLNDYSIAQCRECGGINIIKRVKVKDLLK